MIEEKTETGAASSFRILIVEDSAIQAAMLRRMLSNKNYSVSIARNGAEGLAMIKEAMPSLVITDVTMPVMDGYEMCRIIKYDSTLRTIPVILLTSLSDINDVIKGLHAEADSYITKPYEEKYLMSVIETLLINQWTDTIRETDNGLDVVLQGQRHTIKSDRKQIFNLLISIYEQTLIQNRELIKTQNKLKELNDHLEEKIRGRTADLEHTLKRLNESLDSIILVITTIVEMKDPYTAGHQKRVATLAAAIAKEMELMEEQIRHIYLAGIIHDLGKIWVPSEILSKPGRLSDIEVSFIQTHLQAGYDILKNVKFAWPLAEVVLEHHEKINGSGYPRGLKDKEIMLEAKILSVADTVEAMSSHRPYRPGMGIEIALDEITKNKGILYDPDTVDACVRLFREKGFKFSIGL